MSINPKNPAEIESMRKGGKILGEILEKLEAAVEPGVSTLDLERMAEQLFKEYGVKPGFKGYHGYPAILCTSVNNAVVHSIPNDTPMKEGDILSIDCGVILDDLNTDSAVAVIVGKGQPEVERFVNTCIRALWAGIREVKPGNRLGDIGHAIEKVTKDAGYKVVPELTGHGIGYKLHEEPYVFNYGKRGKGMVLKPGMTLALEPILVTGGTEIVTIEDGWTIESKDGGLGIQHEHTILVTESGVEVLTLRPTEKAKL
jgi:methionyl aminopeptidase